MMLGGWGHAREDSPPSAVPEQTALIGSPPADARFCPADYDGDGLTDVAVKGSNGVWYIDVAKCSVPVEPERECADYVDNDLDGFVNDGCPAIGTPESAVQCSGPR